MRKAAARLRSRWRRVTLGCVALLALGYGGAVALLWWNQERLLFDPGDRAAGQQSELPPDMRETWVDVPGTRLNAVHLRLPHPTGVVFLLHGNGVDIHDWLPGLDFFPHANFDVFMIDYRGFGKSDGRVGSQAQLEADVHAGWNAMLAAYAAQAPQPPEGQRFRRVIFGRSLGTGPAAILAAQVQPDLTVLVTPYSSMSDMAHLYYSWVPPFALRYPLHTDRALAAVKTPVLLLHGDSDTLIPFEHSQRLLAVAPQAHLVLVPGAGHDDIQRFAPYRAGLLAEIGKLVDPGVVLPEAPALRAQDNGAKEPE